MSGTAEFASTVKVFDGSTQIGITTATTGGSWSIGQVTLQEGAHTLTATASNAARTSPNSQPVSITVDTTPPTITSTNPADLATGVSIGSIWHLCYI